MDRFSIPHSHGKMENVQDVQRTLQHREPFDRAAELFHSLGDPSRICIFWILCHREECVVNLSALMGMTSPAISHHLRCLKAMGLITAQRMGKEVHYRAADTEASRLLHLMAEQVMEVSCPRQAPCTPREVARQAHDYMMAHLNEKCTIERLSQAFHLNPTTLKAAFRETYGLSLAAHMKKHRLEKAAQCLRNTSLSIGEIARAVGFTSQSRFSEAFCRQYGTLPTAYRKEK